VACWSTKAAISLKRVRTALNEFFYIGSENTGTRGHSCWKLSKNHCHCNARLQLFSQRGVNRWNSLSQSQEGQEDVDAPSVNAFKGRLERRHRHQMADGLL